MWPGRKQGWLAGYRSALRERDVRLLLGGLFTSGMGSWAYSAALLGYVYSRTHSLTWVGGASLTRFLPVLLLSAYGGVVAERVERVRLMIGSDALSSLWQAVLAVVVAVQGPVALVLGFVALTAATNVVYEPAVAATLPTIVSEDDLVAANALKGTIDNLVLLIGPAAGAVLLLLGSATLVFAINAGSFMLSALLVARMRARNRPVDVTEEGRASLLKQMAVGARTIVEHRAARTLVAFCALVSFVYGTDTVLLVAVSEHRLGTGQEGFAYLLAGIGLGGVLMAGAVDRLSRSARLGPIIVAGVAGYTLPTALLTVIHNPGLAVALQVLRGASTLVVDVMAITALQRSVPGDQLGRVFGVFWAFIVAAITLGTLVTPELVNAFGLNAGLWTMALGPVAVALLGYPALMAMDRDTANRTAMLAPKVAILEQLGIFAAARRSVLERLAAAEVEETFAPTTVIVREGEPAEALFVLVEGQVEVTAHGERGGPERRIRTMTAPTYFGEIGVLENVPRTATVRALTACRCERIRGETLLETLITAPPSTAMMENARSRLLTTHPSRQAAAATSATPAL